MANVWRSNKRLFHYALNTFPDLGDMVTTDDINRGRTSVLNSKLTFNEKQTLIRRMEMCKKKKGIK